MMDNLQIFIAGPRAISSLTSEIESRLYSIYEKGLRVLVGDADGIDTAVQKYFSQMGYRNVIVYASNGKARNNLGNWTVKAVPVHDNVRGFDFYAMKDKAMANVADYGFMIWNGKSKGTFNNIMNLLNRNKKVLVYSNPQNMFVCIDSFEKLEAVIGFCDKSTKTLIKKLR